MQPSGTYSLKGSGPPHTHTLSHTQTLWFIHTLSATFDLNVLFAEPRACVPRCKEDSWLCVVLYLKPVPSLRNTSDTSVHFSSKSSSQTLVNKCRPGRRGMQQNLCRRKIAISKEEVRHGLVSPTHMSTGMEASRVTVCARCQNEILSMASDVERSGEQRR